MKTLFQTISAIPLLALCLGSAASAQTRQQADPAQAVKNYLAGQRFLVTYRQGGAVYGTHFSLDVNLCRSGSYVTFGESRKASVLDYKDTGISPPDHVRKWRDQGQWNVIAYGGQVGVQYRSTSGQVSFYPIRIGPDGRVYTNGMDVARQGTAQCQ